MRGRARRERGVPRISRPPSSRPGGRRLSVKRARPGPPATTLCPVLLDAVCYPRHRSQAGRGDRTRLQSVPLLMEALMAAGGSRSGHPRGICDGC